MMQTAKLLFTFVAGLVIGAAAVPGLQAQPRSPAAYVVEEIHVTEPAGFMEYVRREPGTLGAFHGRIAARAFPDTREGAPLDGSVAVIAFDSAQDANHWYNSPAYANLIPLRQKSATARVYILDGIH